MVTVRTNTVGIIELAKAFKELEDIEGSQELRDGLKAAADIAASEAQMRANVFSFTAADAVTAGATPRNAYVRGGKATVPWYGWADFGSRTPRTGQPRSVGPWANSGKGPAGGRFIYPAIEFRSEELAEAVADAIDGVTARLGFT